MAPDPERVREAIEAGIQRFGASVDEHLRSLLDELWRAFEEEREAAIEELRATAAAELAEACAAAEARAREEAERMTSLVSSDHCLLENGVRWTLS